MDTDNSQKLVTKMSIDMRTAMKARDTLTTETLKSLLAQISNAQAVKVDSSLEQKTEVPRKELTTAMIHEIIKQEITEIKEAAAMVPGNEYKAESERKTKILTTYLQDS